MNVTPSSFEAFAQAFGLDGNSIESYDAMIDAFLVTAFGEGCRFIESTESICSKIRKRKTLTARFNVPFRHIKNSYIRTHETSYDIEIPIMMGSRYAPRMRDDMHVISSDYACFLVDGLKYVLVPLDQRNFNEPYIHMKKDKGAQALYVMHRGGRMFSISVYFNNLDIFVRYGGVEYRLLMFFHILSRAFDATPWTSTSTFINAIITHTSSSKVRAYVHAIDLTEADHVEDTSIKEEVYMSLRSMGDLNSHCYILAILVSKLVSVCLGEMECDDEDDEVFKRVESATILVHTALARSYRWLYGGWSADECTQFKYNRNVEQGATMFEGLTGMLEQRFRKDEFISRAYTKAEGVSFEPTANTPIELLSCTRKVKVYLSEDIADHRVRMLNPSHYGFLCAYETTESKSAGLSKTLASTAVLTLALDPKYIRELLEGSGLVHVSDGYKSNATSMPVFVDGAYYGWTTHPDDVIQCVIERKRVDTMNDWDIDPYTGYVPRFQQRRPRATNNELVSSDMRSWRYVSAYKSLYSVCILIGDGRIARPMLRSEGHNKWVEMVDMAAYKSRPRDAAWRWYEMYDNAMLGLAAGIVPFTNMTQAPRVAYQASMAKQALSMGYDKFNSSERLERVLIHPQKPLITSDIGSYYMDRYLDYRDQNVVIAIMSDVQNNEDALVVNADSVDRGLIRSCKIRRDYIFKVDVNKKVGTDQKEVSLKGDINSRVENVFTKIDFTHAQRSVFIDCNTLCSSGTSIVDGDKFWHSIADDEDVVVVSTQLRPYLEEYTSNPPVPVFDNNGTIVPGMKVPKRGVIQTILKLNKLEAEHTYVLSQLHPMTVVDTSIHHNAADQREDHVEINMNYYKSLEVGDKVETLHAQKSIVGKLVPGVFMPYDEHGVRPDFIMNPHAIPSRMTMSTLFAALLGRTMCTYGIPDKFTTRVSGSVQAVVPTFEGIVDELMPHLHHNGYVTLRCGRTGEVMKNKVFMGVLPYRGLKHQVMDKYSSRRLGPVDTIHGQPVSGGGHGGGTRMGNMEEHALEAHGASSIMLQRNRVQTNEVLVKVCITCGYQSACRNVCICSPNIPMVQAPTTQTYQVFERLLESFAVKQSLL
jgi:DNA-directed RNA polymerase subunit B